MRTPKSSGASGGGPDHDPAKRPQDAFQLRPEWCRVTLASIGDAVITTDTAGRITFLNAVAESLTGWTGAEATGDLLDRVFRVISEDGRRPIENPTVRALRDGTVVELARNSLLIAKDGTERPIGDTAAPIRDDAGEVVGAVLVFQDVSERRRGELQVEAALAYADNIIATLREPFVVLDRDLRVQTANPAFYRNFQVSNEDTDGRFIYDLGNRQWDVPRLRTALENVLLGDHSFSDFEVEHRFPIVGRRVMLLNARRIASMHGRPELILLAIEDVTDIRMSASAVRTSEVRYRRLFETAKDGILILDADTGTIVDANPYMTELLGYSHTEFMGQELWQIGLFGDKTRNEAAVRQLQEHGYVRYDHLPLESRTGKRVDVEFVSNVYRVDHRHVAQCNIRDIGERTRLERQTQEQAAELSDLHRRKDEFLAMLSHELRSPLAPIMNAVQLLGLQQATETPVQRQARTIIARQAERLKYLVDDLLEVSRITTGRVRLRRETVAVSDIVAGAVETARPLIDQHKHELTVSQPLEPMALHADAARLEQVLVNLLTNAAKYTERGGHIWLTVQREGDACVLRVRDTGVGIAPELLPRIFDLFTQAERLLDRSQGGLGIGLSLVQRLTELHGGTVDAFSTPGEGSEFVVRLPALPMSALMAPSLDSNSGRPTAGRVRVLVVDDDVDTADSLALLVKSAGHDVRTVHDGPTALDVALDYLPHAVLLDIGLPGLHGYDVAKRLRQQAGLQNVMLVAVTGYGREADRLRSHEQGFDHHLVKPPDFGQVRDILASVAERSA